MKRSIPPLCIAVVALVIAGQTIRRSGTDKPARESTQVAGKPCSEADLAPIDGLEVGQSIGDFKVLGFRCPEPKVLEIDLRRDETPFVLIVADPGVVPHDAPRQTPRHDLFYNKKTPENEPPTGDEITKLLTLLGQRVEAAEKKSGAGK